MFTGGKNDVTQHSKTDGHRAAARASASSASMTNFFVWKGTAEEISVIRAEVLFSDFLVQHNLSFATADHFCKNVSKMFPDSTIAKKFASGKTKSTQIVKGGYA